MKRAVLMRAAGAGRTSEHLAAIGTWFAAVQQSAFDVVTLASAHQVIGRGYQNDALGSGEKLAWGTIPEDGSRRTVQDYNTLISLMARRRR